MKMSKDEQRLLGQLEATLRSLHEDVQDLKRDVEELRTDFIKRATLYRALNYIIGIGTTIVTLFINFYIKGDH